MEFMHDLTLERFILDTKWERFSGRIRERAVACSLDLMGALLLGARGRQCDAGVRLAHMTGQHGQLPVPGRSERFTLLGAVMAMGHAANSFDIDDGHNAIKGHPGSAIVAGTLAAAIDRGLGYREYLTTLVVAYEAAIRCGLAMQRHYGYLHSSGAYGAFGTAAAMGRAMGFTFERLGTALSIADFHAPMVPVMRSVEHPSMNKDGVPQGAIIGALAVLECLAGGTGAGYTLELPEFRSLVDSLGGEYEIMNLYFKPYTCCRWAHQPITACIALMREYGFGHDDVGSATVHTFEAAARLSKLEPRDTDQAQYNIAWPVAAAIVHGDVGYMQVRDEALDDQAVLSVMKRLRFAVDPELDALFPQKRLAWVEIELKDGRRVSSQVTAAPGEASDNIGLDWVVDKFRRVTAPVLSGDAQGVVIDMLANVTDRPMDEMIALINEAQGLR